jgi:hypothetical protein
MSRKILGLTVWVIGVASTLLASDSATTDLAESRQQLDRQFRESLEQLANRCEELNLNGEMETTRAWFISRDPNRQYIFLLARPTQKTSDGVPTEVDHFWRSRFLQCRSTHADSLFRLAKEAMTAGRTAMAYQLLHEVLREAPEHKQAIKILGHVPHRLLKPKPGRSTHQQFGWPPGRHWTLVSPHFRITTDLSPEAATDLAIQLEEVHSVWQQVFFRVWTSPDALKERFAGGAASLGRTPKHRVVLFRDRKEYLQKLLPFEPKIQESQGYYMKGKETAYLYGGDGSLATTWFHEVVHQLFQETGRAVSDVGEPWNFWVVEGIAVYFESLVRHSNYYTVGGFDADRLQFARARRFSGDFYMPAAELGELGRKQFQAQGDMLAKIYTQSAGLAHFLMDGEGGRFRRPWIEFLRLVYRRQDSADTLPVLLGLPFEKVDEHYAEFLQVDDDDLQYLKPAGDVHSLSLGRTGVTDTGILNLPELRHLDWLDLSYMRITDAAVKHLAKSPTLSKIDLERTAITNESLKTLGLLQGLEEVDLSGTVVDDDGLKSLVGARQIKVLWLAGTKITDRGLEVLRTLTGLKHVDVNGTRVTEEARASFQQWLKRNE